MGYKNNMNTKLLLEEDLKIQESLGIDFSENIQIQSDNVFDIKKMRYLA